MTNLTAWEQEWVQVQEDLRRNPGVQVLRDVQGPITREDPSRDAGGSEDGPPLDPSLYERSVRFSEIGSQWQTVEPYPLITGEFSLTPLAQAVREDPPPFASSFHSKKEQRIGRELRVIDDAPFTGAGSFAAIRLQPAVTNPEVWFSDDDRGLWKMDLDYSTYVGLLRFTKGAFDWQHLFTQAPLGDAEFQRTAERIVNMADALPRIFPNVDHSGWHARLEARL